MCLISTERDHLFSFDLLQLHPSHIVRKEKNCISSHQKRRQTCIFEIPLNEHSNLHISQNSTIFNYMQPRCKRIKVQLLRNAGSTPIDILHNMAKDLWWLKVEINAHIEVYSELGILQKRFEFPHKRTTIMRDSCSSQLEGYFQF